MKNNFSLMPLGGVEEIGSNMTLIRTNHEDILIDCGILFPYEDFFDINYLIPDFSILDASRLTSIVITHAHEDHIGALSHLISAFPHIKIYATKFAHNLISKKVGEKKLTFQYHLYHSQEELKFKEISITPVFVNHSIPETHGLIIAHEELDWAHLYISDFKVDLTASHEPAIDLNFIRNKLSQYKNTAYFLDSTNILNDGKTVSENELDSDLKKILERDEKRIFMTLFSSNVSRLNTITKFAKESGRKIVLMGRSLFTYMEAAWETGHLECNPEEFLLAEQGKMVDSKVLVLLSGCQGDFLSALRRFSFGEDSHFKPAPGDLVVFSSKVIPGNEKKIGRIYNKITEFGAEIVTAYDALIHASGHPGKKDLELLISAFTPNYYFPIHGESYFLRKHKEFVEDKFPEVDTHVIYNYHEIHFLKDRIKIEVHEDKEPILIHGNGLVIEKTQISQRRKMATQGTVFISFLKNTGAITITTQGLPLMAQDLLPQLEKKLLKNIHDNLMNRKDDYFIDQVKISTRQFFNHMLGYKPVTEVHLY